MSELAKRVFDVVLEPSDGGGFTVYAPGLRGCVSEGDTEAEALENIKEAIALWLDTWEEIAAQNDGVVRVVEVVR
jgi:predicted RNase H-like HicB family nuclease